MASSGSFNTNGYEGRYLTFSWSLASQSAETNSSVISWSLKGAGNASSSWYNAGNFKVVINGTTVYSSSTRIKLYNGTVVASGSFTINHNNDGTKSFSASAQAGIYYVAVNCSGSGSWSLPTINRYALITSVANFNDTGDPSVSFTNPNNATIKFDLVANGNVIATRTVSSPTSPYKIVLTDGERTSLRNATPNSNTLTVTYRVNTMSGSSIINTSSANATMTIVAANPTISNISYRDTNTTTTTITGNNQNIIQSNSTVSFTIGSIQALKGATLTNVKITVNAVTVTSSLSGASQSNKTVSFGSINSSSSLPATIVVTDSRGNTTTATVNITMLAWSLPTAIITCARRNNYYSETDLKVNADYSSLGGNNTISIKYQTKESGSSTWSSQVSIQDDVTTTITLDNTKAWDIKVIVTDRLGSTTYNLSIDKGIPLVYFDRLKRSVGFNCFPKNDNSVESEGLVLDDIIYIGSQTLYDYKYLNSIGYQAVLGAYGYKLIDGIFAGIGIPQGYTRAYRVSAQVSTNNSNYGKLKLNNIESNGTCSWSGQTMRALISTRVFKESEITLEPTYVYTSKDGINLYLGNTATGEAYFWDVTLHAYLVKESTTLPQARAADVDVTGGEPAT